MAMSVGSSSGKVRAEINITPLVDVVLVLLIIFMVMTPIFLRQLDLDVPEKADSSTPPEVGADQLVLRIAASGTLELNHEPVEEDALKQRLEAAFATRREKVLFFDADDEAEYERVVHALDMARGAGAKVLGFVTR
ncbi:MAG: biopolymer transporter ExbD [Deltaproteobacteria bacterium]|nr:biopolymer transporter ExbD [Deltaproteobacteria bacterium]